ncbi:Gfo/Idh/MocA family oxidoreductase [Pseudoflavonifractor sp. DSM 107456]|uniref:Gfo/Idh/MocA family oxidoreductase n=1 Tax=Pseudoflavonifractor gallinarum TaxID=2779352 RepID=A0ABR9RCD2_9FIRM|nr:MULTISPECIES: Gfo/Idh/MocA family oxidoreductase [Pseudoflavonifractor]MBE5056050.1 Gfo/Idh/MocA family oxidoreductase [Pseudoflavonifractor gallinarum]MBT9685590.1 gfo/Idh/MocA family oxidoreductase [Pseudoflavonifractor sp. MCC625]
MRVGILGAGKIAGIMARTLREMENVQAWAVASRERERAEEFARTYGIERAYGSYEELVEDPAVDLIYVATPHSHHAEHCLLCIEHGKPVLCEKAFTANAAQARQVLARAEERGVFLTEAIWTRYMPSRRMIDDLIGEGALGEVVSLTANLGYPLTHVERIMEPALAGGALLDIGIYPLNFASMVLGDEVEDVTSACVKTSTGVDAQSSIVLRYRDGKMATLHTTVLAATEQYGIIYGTKGYLIAHNINNIDRISLFGPDRSLRREITVPKQITGYEYEVEACRRALETGALECPEMPHAQTLCMMEQMDALRRDWGVRYPFE